MANTTMDKATSLLMANTMVMATTMTTTWTAPRSPALDATVGGGHARMPASLRGRPVGARAPAEGSGHAAAAIPWC
jgi:hypothetical protein